MGKKYKSDGISHSVGYDSGFGAFFKILLCAAIFVFAVVFLFGCAPVDREPVQLGQDFRKVGNLYVQ